MHDEHRVLYWIFAILAGLLVVWAVCDWVAWS
jgi:hypothetical protein